MFAKYVGMVAGELIWTRKPAKYKIQKLRKKRSKKTIKKQTKTPQKQRKKILYKRRRKALKLVIKKNSWLKSPWLKPKKASQKFNPSTINQIINLIK